MYLSVRMIFALVELSLDSNEMALIQYFKYINRKKYKNICADHLSVNFELGICIAKKFNSWRQRVFINDRLRPLNALLRV